MARSSDLLSRTPAVNEGKPTSLERLSPLLYAELKTLAARAMRGERANHTLQTTALVHEAWLRVASQQQLEFIHRDQVLGIAASMMRRVLVDHARRRLADKRSALHDPLAVANALWEPQAGLSVHTDIIALDGALSRLESLSPRQAKVVDLKFFAGMELPEIAAVLAVARPTIVRDWRMARAWLQRELGHA